MSSITFIGAGLNRPEYKHILSFRRQVYINPDLSKELPDSLIISYNHNTFRIFLSIDEIKCFICKKPGHIASKCTTSEKSITVTAEVHQEMTSDVLINLMNTAETPENNDNVAKEATEVELPQLDIHKAKTSYSMKRTAPTSPDLDSISIVSEEPDVLADDQSKVSVAPLKQQEFVKPRVSKKLKSDTLIGNSDQFHEFQSTFLSENIKISYEKFCTFLNETKGKQNIVEIAKKHEIELGYLFTVLIECVGKVKTNNLKSRLKRLIKKVKNACSELQYDTDSSTQDSYLTDVSES